jgi:hypothetical protein
MYHLLRYTGEDDRISPQHKERYHQVLKSSNRHYDLSNNFSDLHFNLVNDDKKMPSEKELNVIEREHKAMKKVKK